MDTILKKIKEPFKELLFEEEGHSYKVKDILLEKSVSGMVSDFYESFDKEEVSKRVSLKTGKSQEDLLKEWEDINKESLDRGTRVHLFAENYQIDRSLEPSCPQEKAVVKFWDSIPEHVIPVGSEIRMYHFEHYFAGTADLLLFNTKTQSYIIADYKTNKNLYKNFMGKTMLSPFDFLLDCPLSHYELQLSYYQLLLEQIGIKVERRIVIWLNLEGEYEMIDTADYTELLKKQLQC